MKNATTIKVPKKYEHMIEEIWTEDDGWFGNGLSYWVSIADGFYSPEMYSHTLHESTQKEILRLIRGKLTDWSTKAEMNWRPALVSRRQKKRASE